MKHSVARIAQQSRRAGGGGGGRRGAGDGTSAPVALGSLLLLLLPVLLSSALERNGSDSWQCNCARLKWRFSVISPVQLKPPPPPARHQPVSHSVLNSPGMFLIDTYMFNLPSLESENLTIARCQMSDTYSHGQ